MPKWQGVITALITPFKNGKVDYSSLERLLESQIREGVNGFVVHGTTGESPTLSNVERKEVYDFVRSHVPKDMRLLVGTGSNSTEKTIQASKEAEAWGASGLLVVVPYYNKPPQRGLVQHFTAVADQVNIPVLLYNVPGRTIVSLDLDSVVQLSRHPRIEGIKEASGNLELARKIREACGPEFSLLSGDDGTADEFQRQGGDGVISVVSHILPRATKEKKLSEYKEIVDLMGCEANPIPVKMALHLMGIIDSPELRLPLVELAPHWKEKLSGALKKAGLL